MIIPTIPNFNKIQRANLLQPPLKLDFLENVLNAQIMAAIRVTAAAGMKTRIPILRSFPPAKVYCGPRLSKIAANNCIIDFF